MPQIARFHETFASPTTGLPLSGAEVTIYREGATFVSGSGTSPATLTVRHKGKIAGGDTVFINAVTGTTYSVDSVTDTTVVVSGFAGTLSPAAGDRLVPSNSLPSLYDNDQGGGAAVGNPLTTSAYGLAEAYLASGAYDYITVPSGSSSGTLYQGIVFVRELAETTLDIQGVRTKGEPVFNIMHGDFGAVADDTTDAGPALQAAHDAAQTIGGSVFVPSGPFVVKTEVTWNRNVNLIGEHTPANLATDTETGTVLRRGADVIMINMTGTHRTTDRIGRSLFRGIHFKDSTNLSNKSMIYGKYADNMVLMLCSLTAPVGNTTGGHMIDVEECWDWAVANCLFKEYGDSSDNKYAVNLFNGADSDTNNFRFLDCRFYNAVAGAKTIVSDASGAGGTRNSQITITRCKFEDADNGAAAYIGGPMSHVQINDSVFATGDGRHLDIVTASLNWQIRDSLFDSIGDTPTEYINIDGAQGIGIHGNFFNGIGAATTRLIHLDSSGGGAETDGFSCAGNNFFETVGGTTPLVVMTGTPSRLIHIGSNGGDRLDDDVTTAAPALQPWGVSRLNSTSNAVDGTLAAGGEIGALKTIVMIESSNSSDVSIANHEDGDPEVIRFAAVDDMITLMWTGTEWITVVMSGATAP